MNCVADRTGQRLSLGDIIAKAEGVAGELKTSEYRPMLRKLIEPPFQLKLKGERRLVKGFDLVAERNAKGRSGLVPNAGSPYCFDLKPGLSLTAAMGVNEGNWRLG